MASPALPSNVLAFSSNAELVTNLGRYIVAAVVAALSRHGKFVVGLSGGSLPKVLGQALQSAVDSGLDLHTESWHVFYADERIVPIDHADSNHAACKAAIYDQVSVAEAIHSGNNLNAVVLEWDSVREFSQRLLRACPTPGVVQDATAFVCCFRCGSRRPRLRCTLSTLR